MKLVRSWPARPPAGRPHVVDDAIRLVNDNYDYSGLAGFEDDVIQIDWDTAVSREDLVTFAAFARLTPERVLVAPVPVYPDSRRGLPGTVWNCRRYEGADRLRYVTEDDLNCHLFGFGMVYLPGKLIRAFVDDNPGRIMDDTSFAGWHHRNVEEDALIAWHIRPVHVHYDISSVPL